MTTDTDRLLSLAREVGAEDCFGNDIEGHENAVIVTESVLAILEQRIRQDEREKCARIADEHGETAHLASDYGVFEDTHFDGYRHASERIAAAIRSSGTSKETAHV